MSLSAEQLEQRRSLVTASDAAAVLGISDFGGPHDVYAAKVLGVTTPSTWAMERGNAMEAPILAWLDDRLRATTGERVLPSGTKTRTHTILPWLGATLDGDLFDASGTMRAAVDAKFSGYPPAWTGPGGVFEVPAMYLVQFQVQMTVIRSYAPHVDRHVCPVDLVGEDEPIIFHQEHDPDFEATILEELERFHRDHILPKIPPPYDGSEGAQRLVRRMTARAPTGPRYAASVEDEELARRYLDAARREREAKAERDDLGARIASRIGSAEGVVGQGWRALYKMRAGFDVPARRQEPIRVLDIRATKPATDQKNATNNGAAAP